MGSLAHPERSRHWPFTTFYFLYFAHLSKHVQQSPSDRGPNRSVQPRDLYFRRISLLARRVGKRSLRLETDLAVNDNMGFVCTIQRVNRAIRAVANACAANAIA